MIEAQMVTKLQQYSVEVVTLMSLGYYFSCILNNNENGVKKSKILTCTLVGTVCFTWDGKTLVTF